MSNHPVGLACKNLGQDVGQDSTRPVVINLHRRIQSYHHGNFDGCPIGTFGRQGDFATGSQVVA